MPKLYNGMTGQKLIEEINEYSIDSRGKNGESGIAQTIESDLDIIGSQTINGNLNVNGSLVTEGNQEIKGTLNVNKDLVAENIVVSGILQNNNSQKYYSYDKDYIKIILNSPINISAYNKKYEFGGGRKKIVYNTVLSDTPKDLSVVSNSSIKYTITPPSGVPIENKNSTYDYLDFLSFYIKIEPTDAMNLAYKEYVTFKASINYSVKRDNILIKTETKNIETTTYVDNVGMPNDFSIVLYQEEDKTKINSTYELIINSISNVGVFGKHAGDTMDMEIYGEVSGRLNYATRYINIP